jgi:glycosyltransferase involved in cell wall biosynthesis
MPTDAEARPYSAIIRTLCSFPQVEEVVRALRAQSLPPREIIVVDSGSPDDERSRLRRLADTFIDFPPEPFNFSKALNLGVEAATTPSCLMISSHFVLDDATLVEACIRETEARGMSVYYVSNVRRKRTAKYTVVSAVNFNGFNGFSNACGFVPTALVRERPFREDVFACEDQEWAAWYLRERRGAILKVRSPSIRYLNPRVNVEKKINEELAVACFVERRRLSPRHIAWRIMRSGFFTVTANWPRAAFERRVARELWRARRQTPRKPSRYF